MSSLGRPVSASLPMAGDHVLFRGVFDAAAIGMALLAADGRWLRVNRAFCDLVGRSESELLGLTLQDITHPEDLPADAQRFQRLIRGEVASHTVEKRYVLKDGTILWADVAFSVVADPRGAPAAILAVATDITERKRVEHALRESEARYERSAGNAPGLVFQYVLGLDGRFECTFVSEGARDLCGLSPEEIRRDPLAVVNLIRPEDRPGFDISIAASAASFMPWQWEGRVVLHSGEERWLQAASRPERRPDGTILWDGLIMDVTEQRNLQDQLRQAQRMEAVGRLAGGIAHDFNNLLTAILSNAELVLGELPDGSVRRDVELIRQTAERAAALTRQLLAFSRKQVVEPRLMEVNATVRETQRLLQRTLGPGITLETDLGEIGTILADPGQLEQVLLNLAVNARDAMPDGGTLAIRTQNLDVDYDLARRHRGLRPASYVVIEVEDTGVGMDPLTQARIFEPFFTTKGLGQGTGLGLSTVYGIVKQWGGYIAVDSAPGQGAVFTIYLPKRHGIAAAAREPASRNLPGGSETVLVVEDEPAVRNSVRRILARQGYSVLEANNGAEAIRILLAREQSIDLVLTDLMMPEMTGRELIAWLRSHPGAPRILAMSGYDEQSAMRGEPLPEGAPFLAKPFTVDGLLRAIRAALGLEPSN